MINQGENMGTETAEGFIRYLNKSGIDMPVALIVGKGWPVELLKRLAKPERDKVTGDLVYVAPGGGRVLA